LYTEEGRRRKEEEEGGGRREEGRVYTSTRSVSNVYSSYRKKNRVGM